MNIYAGSMPEVHRESGQWVFVDLGFAEKSKSCGIAIDDSPPEELRFSDLCAELTSLATNGQTEPLNLLLEAPLSVAFNRAGNPTGRSCEKRGSQTRNWYVGLGCAVLVAATYVIRSLHDASPSRKVRLFEGFASFKEKHHKSSHSDDVLALRDIAWHNGSAKGRIIPPEALKKNEDDVLVSAFKVAGMDTGIAPVIFVES